MGPYGVLCLCACGGSGGGNRIERSVDSLSPIINLVIKIIVNNKFPPVAFILS